MLWRSLSTSSAQTLPISLGHDASSTINGVSPTWKIYVHCSPVCISCITQCHAAICLHVEYIYPTSTSFYWQLTTYVGALSMLWLKLNSPLWHKSCTAKWKVNFWPLTGYWSCKLKVYGVSNNVWFESYPPADHELLMKEVWTVTGYNWSGNCGSLGASCWL